MSEFNIVLLVLAGSALTLGVVSRRLKLWGVPDSVVLLLLGIVLGPVGLGVLVPDSWGEPMAVLEQVARLALAIGLMGVALRLPRSWIFYHWRSLGAILLFGMSFMWLAGSLLIGGILGLPVAAALLLGAIVTPTDPVVASALVTGPVAERALPGHLRQIISAESGANDGLAYLFVLSAIFLLTLPATESLAGHVAIVLFGEILGAIVVGGVIGYGAGFVLRKAEEKELIGQPSILMFTTALAFATLAGMELIGSNGILGVFVAGLAFDQQVGVNELHEEELVVEGFDRFFTSPVFILLGLMLPWKDWLALGWHAAALVAGTLLLRRLPLFLLLGGRLRDLPHRRDSLFAGWFGPIGVAALYYAALAHHQVAVPQLWPVVSLLVVASVAAHGLTAVPFARIYLHFTTR